MTITADRYENDWGMVELGWRTHVLGEGQQFPNATAAVAAYRAADPNLQDQYMPPFVIAENGQPIGTINDGDSVIYFDFRADRAIEISIAFTYDDFPHFDRIRRPQINYVGMMEYNNDTHVPALTLVPPISFQHPLTQFLGEHGLHQYAITETVKFGHLTYYFRGNDPNEVPGETTIEIPSNENTKAFVERPWMQSADITDQLITAIESNQYQFLRVNYPNGDMVGHFAELEPTIVALEAVDLSLKRVIEVVNKLGGITIITADHGNAEELVDEQGGPKTSHTTNRVPCVFVDNTANRHQYQLVEGDFGLANLASTIALLLGLDPDPNWLPPIIKLHD
jgi:2,3-bisphosphoglycerate-independent phosphoglycerate mutase